ncbi:hypothetical protein RchiOBHm_Chr1g0316261 [Rosa chinensis]|uniref:Uncharacterized protein n=1 Tax=Rosa chinensis TaxID=74649 RepID=A0A2P6S7K5_ROSCH|nr:hypothetical protein RchiOBHm_Chr1g0316261 [Rosa chinensis]
MSVKFHHLRVPGNLTVFASFTGQSDQWFLTSSLFKGVESNTRIIIFWNCIEKSKRAPGQIPSPRLSFSCFGF